MTGAMAATPRPVDAYLGGRRIPLEDPEATTEMAVARVAASSDEVRAIGGAERAAILDRIAAGLEEHAHSLAGELSEEAGCLTRKDMASEVERAVDLARLTAAETRAGFDEIVNLDGSPRGRHAFSIVRRVPIGPLLGITAFNAPLLIPAHKVCPAIAAGAPILLKPSPRVPGAAVAFAELVVASGFPADAIAVLPVGDELTMALVRDERLPVISFTGGPVGWKLRDAAPRKHVHLELGGPGAVLVAADADLDVAARECTAGGFVRSGQACLSVQRVFAVPEIHDALLRKLEALVAGLAVAGRDDGDPDVGPLVDEGAADRVAGMIEDALEKGARLVTGGERDGSVVTPALLADVTAEMAVMRREVFGPVIALAQIEHLDEAVAEANSIGGMLQAGVFTRDLDLALSLAEELDAGSVIINGSNAWRVDSMPFGGTGLAGVGREGARAMVMEITTTKNIVIRHRPHLS